MYEFVREMSKEEPNLDKCRKIDALRLTEEERKEVEAFLGLLKAWTQYLAPRIFSIDTTT